MGSVTNPAGTVHSIPLAGLADADSYGFSGFTTPQGSTPAQWQFVSLASDHSNVCADAGGTFRAGEITFRLLMVGYADAGQNAPVYPPAADLPLSMSANTGVTTSDGVHRTCKPYVMKAGNNGHAGTDYPAASGMVTVTGWDAGGITASWDLQFNGSHSTGAMSAPWCGTPPG